MVGDFLGNQKEILSYFSGKSVLVTGGAGFIGSNLVRKLVELNARVRVIDNLLTGNLENLNGLPDGSVEFIEGDIRDYELCLEVMKDIDFVSHQAALGSVPRSMKEPLLSHEHNVNGTLNVLWAAVNSGISRVVKGSSSVYGDEETLPKVEHLTGNLLCLMRQPNVLVNLMQRL